MKFLSDEQLARMAPAETDAARAPLPTQIVSNGEYDPLPQTAGSRRMLAHAVIQPRSPGWMDEVERAIETQFAGD